MQDHGHRFLFRKLLTEPSFVNLLLIGLGVDIIDLVTLAAFRIMLSLHHLNARPKKVFKCRRVGRKRCRLHRKCIRKPRVSLFNRVGRFLSFCVRAQFCPFCQNMPEHSQTSRPRSSFRGGGRRNSPETPEQKLLQGLQILLKDTLQASSSGASNKKGKGKGSGKSSGKSLPSKQRDANHDGSYGLIQALQKLTARAAKKPQGLLQRLKTLVQVTERGMLRPNKRKKDLPPHEAVPPVKPSTRFKSSENLVDGAPKPKTRWQRDRSWKARAQDWGVKTVLRGPTALCNALDSGDTGALLCQVQNLDDWNEALQISHAAGRTNVTVVLEAAPNMSPELGKLRYHGWTALNTRAAGYADDKLVQRLVWIARCSPNAPTLVPGSVLTGARRPVVQKHGHEESFVFRISCDMRFIASDNRHHITQGPGNFFRLWLSDLGPNARDLLLHLGDTWGFQKLEAENLVRGFARVKGKDRALQLIKASG